MQILICIIFYASFRRTTNLKNENQYESLICYNIIREYTEINLYLHCKQFVVKLCHASTNAIITNNSKFTDVLKFTLEDNFSYELYIRLLMFCAETVICNFEQFLCSRQYVEDTYKNILSNIIFPSELQLHSEEKYKKK
ncbi:hypothetical protein EDEG_01527 [Edhazardia aedis USNM 41457]|uniref:Uncharacterized protein n=1 Tax=Edhazardia aedis (strain USNM 41457) TaxID=1003232 RepID=J9DS98_EDHAE|nr:hypothetical protein EDEG_01527 [Edhazardia aedis USNM 41457]|eukprot:EJW04177.1 hypothetical protein EDEG_01527 [Edhazardia aedis USNM 41457]